MSFGIVVAVLVILLRVRITQKGSLSTCMFSVVVMSNVYNRLPSLRSIFVLVVATILWTQSCAQEVVREGHSRFADALTAELYENDNECSSSWGVSLMFDLLFPGGTEKTQMEMCDVMSLCATSSEQQQELLWSDTVERLTTAYDGRCLESSEQNGGDEEPQCFLQAPTLEIANSVWIDITDQLSPAYLALVGDLLQQTDFRDENAGATVNGWVNASTRGLIDSIVPDGPLFPPFVLLALNSIYLEASWSLPFAERHTNTDKFYSSPSREQELPNPVNFMHLVDFFPYSHDAIPGYQLVQLPYTASSLSMVVVLPTGDSTALSSTQVLDAVPSLNSQRVALGLPRFRFASTYKDTLENGLLSIQLQAPFTTADGGGFCSLFAERCQFLDLVIQKTVIDVNEKGTIAAAVTLGAVSETSAPIDVPILFLADHGFQFFLYDSGEDLVLFEGRVGAPEVVEGSPAAQLEAVHSDPNFWINNFGVDPSLPPSSTNGGSYAEHIRIDWLVQATCTILSMAQLLVL